MIADEGSSNKWGGLSAITILAKQHRVRVDVYNEIGNHVQQVQPDEVSFPLLNIVRVIYTMPPIQDGSVKAKSNKKDWSKDEHFVAALNEWQTDPPKNNKGKPLPMSKIVPDRVPQQTQSIRSSRE